MNPDLVKYYAQRAAEYEKIYHLPERQEDLRRLEGILSTIFAGRNVLEIACGTGYWTQFIARRARSIRAIDCNEEVLEVARQKDYQQAKVTFEIADAYSLAEVAGNFDGGLCGFWLSHVPYARLSDFIKTFHGKLQDEALVVIIDNNYVVDSSRPILGEDEQGNTYQLRKLQNGSEHKVLKNFLTEGQLRQYLGPGAANLRFSNLTYYWLAQYQVKKVG